ncbi:MAG: deoxyribodipyrimidine photo-lyase, partial [Nitrosopumilaceae archaeon]|nr:deoxyribodipyrimidine photo-lyase [Nitrosopumilaceae archaeon]
MEKFQKSLFLFTRDLRIEDNTGLIQACKNSENVLPCFIFNPKISWLKDSKIRTQFLIESLFDLEDQFNKKDSKLNIFSGKLNEVIQKIINEQKIDAIFTNLDYTPYAKQKITYLKELSNKKNVSLNLFHDVLLHEIGTIKTDKGMPYVIYSQFFKKAKNFPVIKPQKNNFKNFEKSHIKNNVNLKDLMKKYS